MIADGCAIEGCNRKRYCRGWCSPHYQRFRRTGDPGGSPVRNPEEAAQDRYRAKLERVDGCLIWTGKQNGNGYGQLFVNGRLIYVHRYAWSLANGDIPDGKMIDHVCHVRLCCEVEHLRLASPAENSWNLSGPRGGVLGVRNVTEQKGKYRVRLKRSGSQYNFGTFERLDDAAKVAHEARRQLFGEFCGKEK